MPIPARLIRKHCDDIPGQRPQPCFRETERRERILDGGQAIMAIFGRAAIKLTDFAIGMRMAPITIRRHFPDMDSLLAEILRRHLCAIVTALGQVPRDTPNRAQAHRAAYLAATRTPLGAPTEAHLLLIRDRHLLPPDEFEPLEAQRLNIGDILAAGHAPAALALLDMPELSGAQIEAALAAIARPAAPAQQPRPKHAAPRLVHLQPPPPPLLPPLLAPLLPQGANAPLNARAPPATLGQAAGPA
jgi:AcrR family transcriptional regulator